MNLWQKIVESSGLPECESIAAHICKAIQLGDGDNRVFVKSITRARLGAKPVIAATVFKKEIVEVKMMDKPTVAATLIHKETVCVKTLPKPVVKVIVKCLD